MVAAVWERIDEQAIKRRISRALIIEVACDEYLTKLERLDQAIERKDKNNGINPSDDGGGSERAARALVVDPADYVIVHADDPDDPEDEQ